MPASVPVIVNPVAGNGLALRLAHQVGKRLREVGCAFDMLETQYPGHAGDISRRAMEQGAKAVFCIGGDGTVLETAQGIVTTECALGIVPGGTGNDFIKALNLPHDPMEALEKQLPQLATGARGVDAGKFNGSWFLNIAGTGFDAEAAMRTQGFKKFAKGLAAYVMGAVSTIIHYKPVCVTLSIDGHVEKREVLLVDACNGRYFGGGMMIAPHAHTSDGQFDLVMIKPVARWRIIFLLPKLFDGSHLSLPEVEVIRCRTVRIDAPNLLLNIDGEVIKTDYAELELVPGALMVLAP